MSRNIKLQELKITVPACRKGDIGDKGQDLIQVNVNYSTGGMCFLSGINTKRGYFLCFNVVRERDGSISCLLSSMGLRYCLQEANRFSAKTLQALAETALNHPKYQEVLDETLRQNECELVPAEAKTLLTGRDAVLPTTLERLQTVS
jgi:hypothetical protein